MLSKLLRLFSPVEQDLHTVFHRALQDSQLATRRAEQARLAWQYHLKTAHALALQTQLTAEAAANHAMNQAKELAHHARAAAELAESHLEHIVDHNASHGE